MIRVRTPGPCSSLQDQGRHGWQSLGVGTAGAMDRWAARVANTLLDNDANAPLLEVTLGGAEFEVLEPGWFALTGADMAAACNGQPLRPFNQLRLREANDDGAGDQRHAEPSEESNEFFHDQPLHRSVSTDFRVRKSPKVMKLR